MNPFSKYHYRIENIQYRKSINNLWGGYFTPVDMAQTYKQTAKIEITSPTFQGKRVRINTALVISSSLVMRLNSNAQLYELLLSVSVLISR